MTKRKPYKTSTSKQYKKRRKTTTKKMYSKSGHRTSSWYPRYRPTTTHHKGRRKSTQKRAKKRSMIAPRITKNLTYSVVMHITPTESAFVQTFSANDLVHPMANNNTLRVGMQDISISKHRGVPAPAHTATDQQQQQDCKQVDEHQPFRFTNYMRFYQHFTVLGSKMTVKYLAPGTHTACLHTLKEGKEAQQTHRSETEMIERHTRFKKAKEKGDSIQLSTTYSGKKYHGKKHFSTKPDSEHTGTHTESPISRPLYRFSVAGLTNSEPLTVTVTIKYSVLFTKPNISEYDEEE